MITQINKKSFKSNQGKKKQNSSILIVLILLLATGLYFYQLGAESFWTDEFYSVYDAELVPGVIPLVRPLYYILLRLWMLLGDSDVWLRSLSIPFALGSIFLTYRLGKRLFPQQEIGLIAALLMTLAPVFINHAQEVRMYTLSTCLSLGGTLAFVQVLQQGNEGKTSKHRYAKLFEVAQWLVLRLLAVLTTPLNAPLLLPDGLLVLWKLRQRRRFLLICVLVILILGVVSLPWTLKLVSSFASYFGGWAATESKPTLVNILSRLTIFTAYWPLQSLQSPIAQHFYKLYTVILLGLLGLSLWRGKLPRQRATQYPTSSIVWLAMWTFLPAVILFAVSWLMSPVWLPRYLLFVAPYLLILLAVGFVRVQRWQPQLAVVIALVYFLAVGGGIKDYYNKTYRVDWREALATIEQQEQPGDAIAMYLNKDRPPYDVRRYYHGSAPMTFLIDKEKRPGERDVKNWQARLPSSYSRLWLVYNDNRNSSEPFRQQVEEKFQLRQHQIFTSEIGWEVSVEVFLVTPKENNAN